MGFRPPPAVCNETTAWRSGSALCSQYESHKGPAVVSVKEAKRKLVLLIPNQRALTGKIKTLPKIAVSALWSRHGLLTPYDVHAFVEMDVWDVEVFLYLFGKVLNIILSPAKHAGENCRCIRANGFLLLLFV
jgi:hypothetical protein